MSYRTAELFLGYDDQWKKINSNYRIIFFFAKTLGYINHVLLAKRIYSGKAISDVLGN